MVVGNAAVAGLLRQYAAALTLEGADRFRIKAYRRAADTLDALQEDVADLVATGRVTTLPGIGKAIGGAIEEIVRTGTMAQFDKAVAHLPPASVELALWPALDQKKISRIYKKLKIRTIDQLRERLASGEIREKLGARLEFHVRHGLAERPGMLLWNAERTVANLEGVLRNIPDVAKVATVGSIRRKRETVGDVNFLVAGPTASVLFREFAKFGGVEATERGGEREASYRMSSGLGITVLHTTEDVWGLDLIRSTGSAVHLEELAAHSQSKRIDFRSGRFPASMRSKLSEEASIYEGMDLSFIEPELREGRGEIEAAGRNRLPRLISASDLRGDLHMHTTASDGADSMLEMARAALSRGYEYIAITDHSQSLKITNGLSEARLRQQIAEIDRLNDSLRGITLLKSAEVDILEDGSLDYPDSLLAELDLTICSIHSRFALDKRRQTERLLRAMDNPHFHILGHPTGRLLLKREGYEIDIDRLIAHAKRNGCFFEINSNPNRLDLCDEHARLAKAAGVKIAINTDAHSIAELGFISAGLNQARRGWLEKEDVVNALSLRELRKALRR